jgi:hypothetical protein
MYLDRFSKTLLCILVLMLGLLVFRPFFSPEAAQTQARNYDYVRYLGGFNTSTGQVMILLDSRNGNIWSYGLSERRVSYVGQLTQLGQPLVQAP